MANQIYHAVVFELHQCVQEFLLHHVLHVAKLALAGLRFDEIV